MISLVLSAVLSQVSLPPTSGLAPVCKAFSFSEATALTEDVGYAYPGRYHIVYSEFEALECGSVDVPANAEVLWTIEYPLFNAVDCARARPRAALVSSDGSRVDLPMLTAFKDGVCKTEGITGPRALSAQIFVWAQVPQSRLRLVPVIKHAF